MRDASRRFLESSSAHITVTLHRASLWQLCTFSLYQGVLLAASIFRNFTRDTDFMVAGVRGSVPFEGGRIRAKFNLVKIFTTSRIKGCVI